MCTRPGLISEACRWSWRLGNASLRPRQRCAGGTTVHNCRCIAAATRDAYRWNADLVTIPTQLTCSEIHGRCFALAETSRRAEFVSTPYKPWLQPPSCLALSHRDSASLFGATASSNLACRSVASVPQQKGQKVRAPGWTPSHSAASKEFRDFVSSNRSFRGLASVPKRKGQKVRTLGCTRGLSAAPQPWDFVLFNAVPLLKKGNREQGTRNGEGVSLQKAQKRRARLESVEEASASTNPPHTPHDAVAAGAQHDGTLRPSMMCPSGHRRPEATAPGAQQGMWTTAPAPTNSHQTPLVAVAPGALMSPVTSAAQEASPGSSEDAKSTLESNSQGLTQQPQPPLQSTPPPPPQPPLPPPPPLPHPADPTEGEGLSPALPEAKAHLSSSGSKGLLTLPTQLTLCRVLLVPVLVPAFYSSPPLAFAIFLLAALTDWLDGILARKMNQKSEFGAFLDPVADKLMVAAVLVLLCSEPCPLASLPHWALTAPAVAIILREVGMSAVREWAATQGPSLRNLVVVSSLGKWKTATQLLSLGLLLFARMDLSSSAVAGASACGLVFLHAAAVLSVWSFARYASVVWGGMTKGI